MVLCLLADLVGLLVLTVRSRRAIQAENLVLRRQLALFRERGVKPRRVDAATRVSLAWLARLCDWRSSMIVVRPETMVRWHRAGWRLLWRYKSRPGRPPIPLELRQLIRRMATENPLWGDRSVRKPAKVAKNTPLSGLWSSPQVGQARTAEGKPLLRALLSCVGGLALGDFVRSSVGHCSDAGGSGQCLPVL